MDLTPPLVLALLGLPTLLVALGLYLRRRWTERAVQGELERIGHRLNPEEWQRPTEPLVLDAERFAELYRLAARAELKVGALLARRRHGEVDLDERLAEARQSLLAMVDFSAEQGGRSRSEWRSAEMISVLALSESLLAEPVRLDEGDEREPGEARLIDPASWRRLAEMLRSLRARLREDFNAGKALDAGQ